MDQTLKSRKKNRLSIHFFECIRTFFYETPDVLCRNLRVDAIVKNKYNDLNPFLLSVPFPYNSVPLHIYSSEYVNRHLVRVHKFSAAPQVAGVIAFSQAVTARFITCCTTTFYVNHLVKSVIFFFITLH